jgi:hypothetical protein
MPLLWIGIMGLLWELGLSAPVPSLVATLVVVGAWFWRITPWGMSSMWLRNTLTVAYIIELGFLIAADIRYPQSDGQPAIGVTMLLVVYTFLLARSLRSSLLAPRTPPVDLEFPLAGGRFCVVQGGNDAASNHHVSSVAQRAALDIVALGPFGTRARGIAPLENERFFIYGSPVSAPCDGIVVAATDGADDVGDSLPTAFGNAVGIQRDDGVIVVLAHLQRGSVAVRTGDRVAAGAPVGRVGNSGRSTEPHLHLHAEREGRGIPMRFNGRSLVRNAIVRAS